MQRIVGLLDMDYFYAQVEEREKPELKGKPVVVGMYSGRTAESGAVATCNYEARKLGIHSGMPLAWAKKAAEKHPETVFVPVRIEYYREISGQIMEILHSFSGSIETVGLDEAYFDLTEKSKGDFEKAKKIALEIKQMVLQEQRLMCSIGLASNKLIAKIAADSKKPDGLTIILPEQVRDFLNPLPPKKLLGVGIKTEEKLEQLGIRTIEELSRLPLQQLKETFGNAKGELLYNSSRGIDDSPIESDWQKLQLSRIKTLPKDSSDWEEIADFMDSLAVDLFVRVQKENAPFKAVSIICVSKQLESFTKIKSLSEAAFDVQTIQSVSRELIKQFFELHPGIVLRRAGVKVEKLVRDKTPENSVKQPKLTDFG
ncbi:MAG: DNA polymerase IV [Candidatus Micrarchaeota archaeon]